MNELRKAQMEKQMKENKNETDFIFADSHYCSSVSLSNKANIVNGHRMVPCRVKFDF